MRPNCAYHRDHPHTNTECCRNRWHPSLSCQTAMNGLPFVWVFNTGLQGLYIHTYIQQLQQHTAYSSNFVHSVLLLAIPWLVHACNSKQIIQCVRWHKPSAHPHQKYIYVCYVKTRVHEDHLFIFNVAFYEWQEKKTTGLNCATCTEHNRIDVSFYCSNIRNLSLHCIARSQILHKFVIHTSPVCCIMQLVFVQMLWLTFISIVDGMDDMLWCKLRPNWQHFRPKSTRHLRTYYREWRCLKFAVYGRWTMNDIVLANQLNLNCRWDCCLG